jgi:Photosynthetic reaction centre cytochrome C subunit
MKRSRLASRIHAASFLMAAFCLPASVPMAAAQSADYDFFKTRVQPIFLKTRATHGRCVTCHGGGNGGAFVLQPLAKGTTDWTEEQTMRNFAAASRLVQPGKPTSSQLLMHPLAPDAGGDVFHSGGHQFVSQDDPDWQELAAWVRQKPPADYMNLKVLKSGDHLLDVMRSFNLSLREDCAYCHVASDFSSDARPTKLMARQMMQMTEDLNAKLGAGNITCYTCHRGDGKPRTVHPRYPDLKFPN